MAVQHEERNGTELHACPACGEFCDTWWRTHLDLTVAHYLADDADESELDPAREEFL